MYSVTITVLKHSLSDNVVHPMLALKIVIIIHIFFGIYLVLFVFT